MWEWKRKPGRKQGNPCIRSHWVDFVCKTAIFMSTIYTRWSKRFKVQGCKAATKLICSTSGRTMVELITSQDKISGSKCFEADSGNFSTSWYCTSLNPTHLICISQTIILFKSTYGHWSRLSPTRRMPNGLVEIGPTSNTAVVCFQSATWRTSA